VELSPWPHSIDAENNSLVIKRSLLKKEIAAAAQQKIRIGYNIT